MAKTNPFKAFVPYLAAVPAGFVSDSSDPRAQDPSGGQWRTVHLTAPIKGEGLIVDLNGAGKLMAVQFNERILPGKVRDEQLQAQVKRIEAAEGRKIGKKEYAQLRDEVEFALLPRAFIRRTVIHVIFTSMKAKTGESPSGDMESFAKHDIMLVCTSSQKRADDAVYLLAGTFGETWPARRLMPKDDVSGFLTALARGRPDYEMGDIFNPLNAAVLKGQNKQTIRVKDKEISSNDVQALLKHNDYHVTELAVGWADGEGEDLDITYTVSDAAIFKRVDVPGIDAETGGEDFHGFAVLCVQQYRHALAAFVTACGGLAPHKPVFASDDEI